MYITNSDVAKFLNISLTVSGQSLVDDLIAAVEKYAEDYCNRKWSVAGEQTELYDGNVDTFLVKYPPITSISSIKVNGDALIANTDYFNYSTYIKLKGKAIDLPQTVEIKYTSGVSLPADLKHALVRWTAEIFKSQEDAGKTISRYSIGSISVDFLNQDGIPKFVEMVLNKYRLLPGF